MRSHGIPVGWLGGSTRDNLHFYTDKLRALCGYLPESRPNFTLKTDRCPKCERLRPSGK